MNNMELYDSWREVPQEAQKAINAGRLKGKTDINPMWRIRVLTQKFGPCGTGWRYDIDRMWSEEGANGERCAFVQVSLYYKMDDGNWSSPVVGVGGNMLTAKESKGLYTSDECYKMALTDAISVACKALGIGADVYWSADRTKYDKRNTPEPAKQPDTAQNEPPQPICIACKKAITDLRDNSGNVRTAQQVAEFTYRESGAQMCWECFRRWKNGENL